MTKRTGAHTVGGKYPIYLLLKMFPPTYCWTHIALDRRNGSKVTARVHSIIIRGSVFGGNI